jgi:hypothetical protein
MLYEVYIPQIETSANLHDQVAFSSQSLKPLFKAGDSVSGKIKSPLLSCADDCSGKEPNTFLYLGFFFLTLFLDC